MSELQWSSLFARQAGSQNDRFSQTCGLQRLPAQYGSDASYFQFNRPGYDQFGTGNRYGNQQIDDRTMLKMMAQITLMMITILQTMGNRGNNYQGNQPGLNFPSNQRGFNFGNMGNNGLFSQGGFPQANFPGFARRGMDPYFSNGNNTPGLLRQWDPYSRGMSEGNASFDEAFQIVLGSEGGFSNHAADRGGRTNYGVTQSTYNSFRARNGLGQQDVRNISQGEVKAVYKEFWDESGAGQLPPQAALAVFDMAINSGPARARKLWEQSGGDLQTFMDNRRQFYYNLVDRNPSQGVFLNGWMNRLANLENHMSQIG